MRVPSGGGWRRNESESPLPLGTRITYRYQHLTKRGVPRFPRYLRVREDFPGMPEEENNMNRDAGQDGAMRFSIAR